LQSVEAIYDTFDIKVYDIWYNYAEHPGIAQRKVSPNMYMCADCHVPDLSTVCVSTLVFYLCNVTEEKC